MEQKRETVEALDLPTRVYNKLKRHIRFVDTLILRGEEGLREIDGIGDTYYYPGSVFT